MIRKTALMVYSNLKLPHNCEDHISSIYEPFRIIILIRLTRGAPRGDNDYPLGLTPWPVFLFRCGEEKKERLRLVPQFHGER